MTDPQQARIEAAAEELWATGVVGGEPTEIPFAQAPAILQDNCRRRAAAVLAAADRVDPLRQELAQLQGELDAVRNKYHRLWTWVDRNVQGGVPRD